MHHNIAVSIYNSDDPNALGFGRGMVTLLELIEKTGSIKNATLEMNMAYSKAWRIIKNTEAEFGITLLERNRHCGSMLTPEAKKLIKYYKDMLTAAKKSADRFAKKHNNSFLED